MRRAQGIEKPLPLVGFEKISDTLGGGLWPGLHVLVGNPGSGKSQWALQLALSTAMSGTPVIYVALELRQLQLVARLVTLLESESAVHWSDLYHGNCKDVNGLELLAKHRETLAGLPLRLVTRPPYLWHHNELDPLCRSVAERHRAQLQDEHGHPKRPMLVVLDYLQLVGGNPNEDVRQRVQKVSGTAGAVAHDLNCAVLAVSSTARGHYGTLSTGLEQELPKPWTLMGLGKESGEVEYTADSVMVMCRLKDKEHKLAIAKVRAGVPVWCDLYFDGQQFKDDSAQPVDF